MYAKFIGITVETAALIETHRRGSHESEDDIVRRALAPPNGTVTRGDEALGGCDLGKGAVLREGERLYLFRHKSSRDARKPEAIAEAKGGALYLNGQKIERSKGSLVQPALKMVQERLNDINISGELINLNAWDFWYVLRNGKYVTSGELRDSKQIVRRGRNLNSTTNMSAEDLGL